MVKLTWSQCWNYVQGVDWVREVHRHTSITKAGTNWVLFRSVQGLGLGLGAGAGAGGLGAGLGAGAG